MPNPETNARISARIREAREYLDLSVLELSEMIGVSVEDFEQIEAGAVTISASVLSEIAKTLGRSLEYFTGEVPAAVASERTAFLARAAETLSEQDLGELQRFAVYLRSRSEGAAA